MFRRITSSFLKVPKKARTACMVSIVMPGAGHVYNREVVKGVMLWAMAMGFLIWGYVSWSQYCATFSQMLEQTGMQDIAYAQARASVPHLWVPFVFYAMVVVFAAYDAYLVARQVIDLINREKAIRAAERRDVQGGDNEPVKEQSQA